MTPFEVHEIAELFPSMSPDQYARLEASIEEQGLVEEILLYEGKILDGRHRYRVCQALGLEPRTRDFDGDYAAAVARTLALNFHRRHLTTVQRAALGVGLKKFEQQRSEPATRKPPAPEPPARATSSALTDGAGVPDEPASEPSPSPEQIASERLGVSLRAIQDAERIQTQAPDVFSRMLTDVAGSMQDARRVARLAEETRGQIHREVDAGATVKEAIRKVAPPVKPPAPAHSIKLSGRLVLSEPEWESWQRALGQQGLNEKQALEQAVRLWLKQE